jgi:hypothetical protein
MEYIDDSPARGFTDTSIGEVDSIDARHIRAETRVMLHSGKAVEKTLKNVFKTDTRLSKSDGNSLATDSVLEFGSSQSSVSKSLLPLSQASVCTRNESVILPLGDDRKFEAKCWDAFTRRAREQGDLPMDGGLCIDIEALGNAMREINHSVTMQQVQSLADKFQLTRTKNVMLSWNDFYNFASTLFEPAAGRPRVKSPAVIEHQVQLDRKKAREGLSHPYNQLMHRQRASSTVRYEDMKDLPSHEIAPFASLVDIGGAKVSKPTLEEKKVKVYRKETKDLRKPLRKEGGLTTATCLILAIASMFCALFSS